MASMLYGHIPNVVGVVGAGQMGSGIAQLVASKGMPVVLADRSQAILEHSVTVIKRSLERFVKKGTMSTDDVQSTFQNISTHTDLEAMREVDFVVEAVSENEDLKKTIFQQLDKITPVHTILASNTSSISITRLASFTSKPHRVIGMHFMNPVPLMQLVELAKGMHTSQQTFEIAKGLAEHMGKQVCLSEDRPGFIVNRVLMPMINEAFFCLMERMGTAEDVDKRLFAHLTRKGVGRAEDIDKGMTLGTNQPMGPLRLADFIGLDTCLSIMRVLHHGLGDSKYRPCPLLVSYVDAGWLGQKVGRGVYTYDPADKH